MIKNRITFPEWVRDLVLIMTRVILGVNLSLFGGKSESSRKCGQEFLKISRVLYSKVVERVLLVFCFIAGSEVGF